MNIFQKKYIVPISILIFAVLIFWFQSGYAGVLTPTAIPTSTSFTFNDLNTRLTTNATTSAGNHDFAPTVAPAASLFTLSELYALIPTIDATKVVSGITYMGTTGTIDHWSLQISQRYDDFRFGSSTTGSPFDEYTGEEASWLVADPGGDTAKAVGDNGVTTTLTSNKVWQDQRTGLYWSDQATSFVDNEFRFDATGECNFLSTGTANSFCDNQDPNGDMTEDDDVSAAEFCLNLELDANNDASLETDWRLPTQKEGLQAAIDGGGNNLSDTGSVNPIWTATDRHDNTSQAYFVYVASTASSGRLDKDDESTVTVRCVR